MTKKAYLSVALMGLALATIQTAHADTHVTFQVDMSGQIGSTFNPPGNQVVVSGSFNGWAGGNGFVLTNNPSAANTNLYTGTYDVTAVTNGGVMDWKYTISGNYESTQDGQNRCATLPTTSGSNLVLDYAYFDDDGPPTTVNMTFRVDMATQIALGKFNPATSGVYCQGLFEGWTDSGAQLTNDPTILRTNSNGIVTSNVYTGVFQVTSAPGGTEQYKFVISPDGVNNTYESPTTGDPDITGGNRFFDGQTNDTVLPIVFFSDVPYNPTETNLVTFQVDMTAQVLNNNFNPSTQQLNLNGAFNNWAASANVMTNNPNGTNTNLYTTSVYFTNSLGATEQFKYAISPIGGAANSGNYEGLPNTTPEIAGNRYFTISTNPTTVLPVVYYAGVPPPPASEFLTNAVTVTFTVDMTNAVGTDATVWNPSVPVYINGDFIGWPAFNTSLPQMTEVGTSSIYTFTTNFPAGHAVAVNYQYSMNGAADESSTYGANHVRYVRTYGTYNFPLDMFGNMLVESSYGNLAVSAPVSGKIPVTWLGRPGVQLQSAPSVTGPWTTLSATDATSSTNITMSGSAKFFRLVHPVLPLE